MSTFAHCVYPNAIAITVTQRKKWTVPPRLNCDDGLMVKKTKLFPNRVVWGKPQIPLCPYSLEAFGGQCLRYDWILFFKNNGSSYCIAPS
jgi:hypothetical protein